MNEVKTAASLPSTASGKELKEKRKWDFKQTWPLHLMILPPLAFLIVFQYLPMVGLVMAFQDYKPWLGFTGSEWIGLEHFRTLFTYPEATQVISNTLIIAISKIILQLITPFLFAIFLNEIRLMFFKRTIQTLVYLPHFLSWVVLGGIFLDIFSVSGGAINRVLGSLFGLEPIFFLGDGSWFRFVVVVTDTWQDFGFGAIVFLAAIAGVDPSLYEAAEVDGANRLQQTWHVTVPTMIPITIVLATLALGKILNAGFDQIFNLYNPLVYSKGDIIDTYVYRTGLLGGQFGFSTAVGMFKSVISLVLIVIAYRLAAKFANYRIF